MGHHKAPHTRSYDSNSKHISPYLKCHGVVDVGQTELFQEALVLAPEESDIRYAEQNHGESFQTQAKGPADFIPRARCKEVKETPLLLTHPLFITGLLSFPMRRLGRKSHFTVNSSLFISHRLLQTRDVRP